MLNIKCPYCGFRDESEFTCGGVAHIIRPGYDIKLTDEEWAEYLFMRINPKGNFTERWFHAHGCRKWFNVVRNTATNEIFEIYPAGSLPKSPEGKNAFKNNWRRNSQAEIKSLK